MGFCNLFPILVILSAAHDLLKVPVKGNRNSTVENVGKVENRYDCNETSTGIVLIADVLPGLFIKILYSAFPFRLKYKQRVGFVVSSSATSFLLISFSFENHKLLMFIGIGLASISTSFGEMTFLSLTTLYPKKIAFFPYAIGLATTGLASSSLYALLTQFIQPDKTIMYMSFIPVLLALSYWLLPNPDIFSHMSYHEHNETNIDKIESIKSLQESNPIESLTFVNKLKLVKPLIKYMIPLFLVFFSEYVINQGLFELLYFKDNYLIKDHSSQYRYYNVMYRVGVFISRIAILYFPISNLALFPLFQILNLVVLLTNTVFNFMPRIEIVLAIILWEGMKFLFKSKFYLHSFTQIDIFFVLLKRYDWWRMLC